MSSVGFLDFFVLEASDYIEQLDGLLARAGAAAPESEPFVRHTRALRGSATMAKLLPIAELSGAVERIAQGLAAGTVAWNDAVRGAVVAAVDDLRILLRGVRSWGPAEDQRARQRTSELAGIVPGPGGAGQPGRSAGGTAFLSTEASDIATGLDAYLAEPSSRSSLDDALRHLRSLRGVAALADFAPLGEVAEALERVTKPLELTGALPTQQQHALLAAAADVLRAGATELAAGRSLDRNGSEMRRFTSALIGYDESAGESEKVVPVNELFYHDDGPHIVDEATSPPTTAGARFRLETVSQAERLRRQVADARNASEAAAREHAARDLRSSLRGLARAADSFGEGEIARSLTVLADAARTVDAPVLAGLEAAADLLADPSVPAEELPSRLDTVRRALPSQSAASGRGPAPTPSAPARDQRGARHATHPEKSERTSGRQLRNLLRDSIAGIARLRDTPLSEPVPIVEEAVIPIDDLLYRGPAALARARELVASLRAGGAADAQSLAELSDLLELANPQ